jgi:glycerophosphoryl diester phosphodiesterase
MTSLVIPKVIGHRGAKAYAPENTLASIHAAADLGIEWVEVDVKLTKDGMPVIFHDEELERCTDGKGLMKDMDYEQVSELDAGGWFGEDFRGEKIPPLEQLIKTVLARGLGVNLEIKPCPGREIETAEVALDVAACLWPDDLPPPLISSFQVESLEAARRSKGLWPRGFLIDEYRADWREIARELRAETVNINGRTSTPEQIADYVRFGKPVLAYTINDTEEAAALLRQRVESVFSDRPDAIRAMIEPFYQQKPQKTAARKTA